MSYDFLFATWEGGGNVAATLGAVRRMAARGHRVRVLGDDAFADEVAAAGGRFLPWRHAPNRPDRSPDSDPLRDWEAEGHGADLLRVLDGMVVGPAALYAADTRAELRRHPADAVVSSDLLFGPMLAAEAEATPLAVLGTNLSIMPLPGLPPLGPGMAPPQTAEEHAFAAEVIAWLNGELDKRLPVLNAARALAGLPPLGDAWDQVRAADRVLLATSRAFDFQPAADLPERVRYVGPLLDPPHWAARWRSPWRAGDRRPLVVVGMSSTFQDQVPTIEALLAALARLPVRVLVTLGPALAGTKLAAPDNAVVVDAAPHDAVMRGAALVVTHAGHGTVMRGGAHGVPLLCLPMGRDQADNAVRVERRGAGLRLPRDATPEALRQAARTILEEPCFAAAARALGAAIARAEPATALEEELEALAAARLSAAA